MSTLPHNLKQIAYFLQRLPGIGEKTANRLAFYFLRMPEDDLAEFAKHVQDLKTKTKFCKICLNLTEDEVCAICSSAERDQEVVTVVEDVLDLMSFETGRIYQGTYHVLHGKIDPLNNIGPDDIHINHLVQRLGNGSTVKEVILATNFDMEGEATAMYIRNRLQEVQKKEGKDFKISRLSYGLPTGANLEYADYMTLKHSLERRSEY